MKCVLRNIPKFLPYKTSFQVNGVKEESIETVKDEVKTSADDEEEDQS